MHTPPSTSTPTPHDGLPDSEIEWKYGRPNTNDNNMLLKQVHERIARLFTARYHGYYIACCVLEDEKGENDKTIPYLMS